MKTEKTQAEPLRFGDVFGVLTHAGNMSIGGDEDMRRVHDVAACRGCAMSHQEATFNADVESGRTIPGID